MACGQEFIEVASVTVKDSTKINSHLKSFCENIRMKMFTSIAGKADFQPYWTILQDPDLVKTPKKSLSGIDWAFESDTNDISPSFPEECTPRL